MNLSKIFFLTIFLSGAIACNAGAKKNSEQEAKVIETLQNYKQCLMERNKELVAAVVDDEFRVGVYQGSYANYMFNVFLSNVDAPDSIYWEQIQWEEQQPTCEVHYIYKNDTLASRVTFSEKGKLLFSDLLDQKGFGVNRRGEAKFVASFPFQIKNNKLILSARLNNTDKVLNMLFDSGADGMALVKNLQEECGVKISSTQMTNVPGGQMRVERSDGNLLMLDSINIAQQSLVLFESIGPGIDGLIGGGSFFRKYITAFDFDNQRITLYEQGQFDVPETYQSCDLTYENGVPTVPFYIYKDDKVLRSDFIFDTGAVYEAILFGKGMHELAKDSILKIIIPEFYSYNRSLGHQTQTAIGKTDSISFANISFANTYLVMESYDKKSARHNVMGSIGIKSLSKFNWIVDLIAYKIYSAPNKRTNLPMDFVLEGYLAGYQKDQLTILNPVVKQSNPQLQVGDIILSINKIASDELTSPKLQEILKGKQMELELKSPNGKVRTEVILKQ